MLSGSNSARLLMYTNAKYPNTKASNNEMIANLTKPCPPATTEVDMKQETDVGIKNPFPKFLQDDGHLKEPKISPQSFV